LTPPESRGLVRVNQPVEVAGIEALLTRDADPDYLLGVDQELHLLRVQLQNHTNLLVPEQLALEVIRR
jgi:hypothetical protein